jgi:hypothetical protein
MIAAFAGSARKSLERENNNNNNNNMKKEAVNMQSKQSLQPNIFGQQYFQFWQKVHFVGLTNTRIAYSSNPKFDKLLIWFCYAIKE